MKGFFNRHAESDISHSLYPKNCTRRSVNVTLRYIEILEIICSANHYIANRRRYYDCER